MPEIMKLIECLIDALILLSLLIFQVASDDLLYRFRRCGKENLFLYQDFTCGFLGILINSYRLFKTLFRCLDYFSYFNMSYAVSCSCNHLCLPFPLTSAHMRILLRASAYFIQVFSCTHN